MTPNAAMQYVLDRTPYPTMLCSLRRKPGRPGEIIERMPSDVRWALQRLTSESMPTPTHGFLLYACGGDYEEQHKKHFEQLEHELKVAFDKEYFKV